MSLFKQPVDRILSLYNSLSDEEKEAVISKINGNAEESSKEDGAEKKEEVVNEEYEDESEDESAETPADEEADKPEEEKSEDESEEKSEEIAEKSEEVTEEESEDKSEAKTKDALSAISELKEQIMIMLEAQNAKIDGLVVKTPEPEKKAFGRSEESKEYDTKGSKRRSSDDIIKEIYGK